MEKLLVSTLCGPSQVHLGAKLVPRAGRGSVTAGNGACAGSRPKEEHALSALPPAQLRAGALDCRVRKALFQKSQHGYEIQQGSNKYFTSWTPQG